MLGWRSGAGVVVTVMGLVGCSTGDRTLPSDPTAAAGSLVGPTWHLTSIGGQPIFSGTTLTAEFSSEDRVSGTAGCNRYMGSAKAKAGRLSVGALGSTRMACDPEGVMAQEGRYLAALGAATSYTVSGDELRLGPSAAEATLVFTSR